jgi:hypothetical protein
MSKEFKDGDDVWVKGTVQSGFLKKYADFVLIGETNDEASCLLIPVRNIRRRVKRKKHTSSWLPIEGAPKDGSEIFLHHSKDGLTWVGRYLLYLSGEHGWSINEGQQAVNDPDFYMLIPPKP